ncbi:heparin lyase I family protein [Thalassotalea sp. PLHSN55]|uniref:heparin lyase I family protein n=1 Tax=Thalassotalea sp. PLHSN55 TaxID=3435888 RepID=UPI003F875522
MKHNLKRGVKEQGKALLCALAIAPMVMIFTSYSALARQSWQANFDNNKLDNWSYVLHSHGIKLLTKPDSSTKKNESDLAAFISITGEPHYLWHNRADLNRVELQYKPQQTLESQSTTVSWQFMLPKLFEQKPYQIAYWESDKSYRQSYRLQFNGDKLALYSAQENRELWSKAGFKANEWYTLTLKTLWSVENGKITLSINGEKQSTSEVATLISNQENMFFQLGILRAQSDKAAHIWLDNVTVSH